MKKQLFGLAVAGLGLVTLASCGGNGSEGAKVYAQSYNLSDPNMSGLWQPGLKDAAKEMGFAPVSLADAKNDDGEAVKMLEAAIVDDYDAYLINVVDNTNGKSYLNKVKPTGKPLVFWNREVSADTMKEYNKAYYVGIESAEGGRYQGKMAAQYVTEKGFSTLDRNGDGKLGVIVVRGEKGHPDAEARTLFSPMYLEKNLEGGNKDADAEVSGNTYTTKNTWNKVEVKAIVDGTDQGGNGWEPVTAATEVARVLNEKGNEIDLVLSNNDGMALGIVTNKQFKDAGIPIWGVDALDDAITEIKKDGTQFMGTVKNDGKAQAKVVMQLAKNLIDGKDFKSNLTVVDTKEDWEANDDAIWYDTTAKAFRVHHALITKANA